NVASVDKPPYEVKALPHPAVSPPSSNSRNKGCHGCSSSWQCSFSPAASRCLLLLHWKGSRRVGNCTWRSAIAKTAKTHRAPALSATGLLTIMPVGLMDFPNTTVSVSCPWYLPWHHKGKRYPLCGSHVDKEKLHCMRNNIHMNLFASFILRALSILIKDALLEANITSQDLSRDQEQGFPQASMPPLEMLINNETTISCRIAVVMMQYSIMANSYWLLVEGIYLHNLLVITVFTERNYFKMYLCIGWGTPLIFLVPWVVVKYLYENQECWGQNINMNYWWIIRSPILLAVVINFLIFIHIIKILVSKLRAHQMRYTDYKFRLAKSTLTLIPLLGIHQVVFIFVTDESTETTIGLRLTKLFIDLFFSSFQVQSEILKKWKRWKLGRNIEEEYRHTYSNTPNTKTGSLLNHVSRLSHLPDIAKTSAPVCSPEERHMLVTGCHNGMVHGTGAGQCGSEGTISNCTLVEDISLADKVRCYGGQRENVESHL
ncbi:hypothetical protein L3Q82_014114, partial [Scortum barcoo]